MTDTDNVSRRRFLQATGGAASAVALAGCTGNDQSDSEETTTTEEDSDSTDLEGTYFKRINSTMSTLDPIAATGTSEGEVIQQIHEPLLNYPNSTIEVDTRLATDYSVSDDLTTYTFNLVEGATFHNGDEVTADDVVYSWERLAASDNSKRAYFILDSIGVDHETDDEGNYVPESMAVEAVDDYTVEMTLAEPFHSVLEVLAYTSFAVIPEGIVGDIDGYEGEMGQGEFGTSNPVGAGPFQFSSWQADTEAVVDKFDDYHGDVPKVDGIHWNIATDPNARYQYAMNKNADYFGIPTEKFDPEKLSFDGEANNGRTQTGTYGEVRNGETLNVTRTASIGNYYIGFNTDAVEKPVRQAFAYAANHQSLAEDVFKGTVEPASHFVPPAIFPGGPSNYEEHGQEYPYGSTESLLDEARKVMEEAGYGDNNRAEVTLTVYESSTVFQETANLLRDMLTSAYIDVTVDVAPFAALREQGLKGNLEAYTLGWIMDWPAPDNFLQLLNPPQTDTSGDSPISYINWSDTDAANQAAEAWQTVSENRAPTDEAQQARNDAYLTMEEANWEDVAMLTLFHDYKDLYSYDWVDIEPFGSAGPTRQMYNNVTIGDRS